MAKKVQDHPHAYGDKFRHGLRINSRNGIIPTRMGTRVVSYIVIVFRRDHPHAYGDKRLPKFLRCHGLGSSPRVWGQASTTIVGISAIGIIPTRMGTRYTD